jgi:flagellar hook-basal body complex protein FliE
MNMIQEILNKFAPQLSKHGVKLSVEETAAPEATAVVMSAEGALADGTMIYSNADAFAEGVDVFVMDASGNATPLADGEYTLDNGMTMVVAAGVIESMAEAMTEEPMAPADAVAQEVAETYSKEQVEGLLKNVISEFEAKLSAAEKKITELSQAPAATTVKQSRQTSNEAPLNIKAMANIEDRTRAIVARYKNK